jgi:hypothetical protein
VRALRAPVLRAVCPLLRHAAERLPAGTDCFVAPTELDDKQPQQEHMPVLQKPGADMPAKCKVSRQCSLARCDMVGFGVSPKVAHAMPRTR